MNTPPYAAFVGIDWADAEHAVCLLEEDAVEHTTVPQEAAALDAWVTGLRQRFGDRPVAVCLEQSRGALLYALLKYNGLVLFPLNPKQLARYREAFGPSGAKNDPGDAELLARFVREHHQRLRHVGDAEWLVGEQLGRVVDDLASTQETAGLEMTNRRPASGSDMAISSR